MSNEDLAQIQTLVNGAKQVVVMTHKNPSVDAMASALAIFLAMQKMGKEVSVVMEEGPLVEVANLVGIDKVKNTLPGKNLMLTYKPYNLGDFEKVTALENPAPDSSGQDSFTMTVISNPGVIPDPKNFTFSYVGTLADLVITIDVLEPAGVGTLFDSNLFSTAPVINIDNHDPNKDYGKFNLVEPDAASISEIVTFFLRAVNVQLDSDIVHNLYEGIKSATNNFQGPKVAAATFEAAAICIRAGAKGQPSPVNVYSQPTQPTPSTQPTQPTQQTSPSNQPTNAPGNLPNSNQNDNAGKVPADWTQPKIFRGGGSLG